MRVRVCVGGGDEERNDRYQRGPVDRDRFSDASSSSSSSGNGGGGGVAKKEPSLKRKKGRRDGGKGTHSKSNVYQQFVHHRPNPRHLHHEREQFWTESAFVEMINAGGAGKGERLAFFGGAWIITP